MTLAIANGCAHHPDCAITDEASRATDTEKRRARDREHWRTYYAKNREKRLARRRELAALAKEKKVGEQ